MGALSGGIPCLPSGPGLRTPLPGKRMFRAALSHLAFPQPSGSAGPGPDLTNPPHMEVHIHRPFQPKQTLKSRISRATLYTRSCIPHQPRPIPPLAEPAVRCSTLRTGSAYTANRNNQHQHGTTAMWATARGRCGSTGPARSDGQPAREYRGVVGTRGGGAAEIKRHPPGKHRPPLTRLDAPLKVRSRRPVRLPLRLPSPRVSLASHQASLPSSVPDLRPMLSRSYLWRLVRHACCLW